MPAGPTTTTPRRWLPSVAAPPLLAEHPIKRRSLGIDARALGEALRKAAGLPGNLSRGAARDFFEVEFAPHEVVPASGGGFFTGYYEPIVEGSRVPTERFNVPLYAVPDDLVAVDPDRLDPAIDPSYRFARHTAAGLAPYADRAAIEAGHLKGRGLELAYLADPVDAFFIHIQGAARIELPDGGDDAGHLCRQDRPPLHGDRQRAGEAGRAPACRSDDGGDPRLARRAPRRGGRR